MSQSVGAASNVIVDERPWTKPWPNIDYDTEPFWTGLEQHKFLLFRCKVCGSWYWPKAYCIKCEKPDPTFATMGWEEASGRGKVFSYNIIYYVFHPGFKDDVPYTQVVVETEEGPLVSSTLIQCNPEEVHVGMPVEVVFEDHPAEEFTMLRFRPRKE
jgi:uncharacterized OB-fold protein